MDKTYLSWWHFDNAVDYFAEAMEGEEFDYILGLTRGGLPLATALSHRLGVPMLTHKIQLRDGDVEPLPQSIANQEGLLVVDDINDSGATLEAVSSQLNGKYVKYCTWIEKESSSFTVDYLANYVYTDEESWIVFPWEERIEDEKDIDPYDSSASAGCLF